MTEPSADTLVRLSNARLGYAGRTVLDGVDLEVRRGDFLACVGPNGAGKTTLLRTILGILKPLAGQCERRGRLGYSPQRSVLDPVYAFTCGEVVAMGLLEPPSAEDRDSTVLTRLLGRSPRLSDDARAARVAKSLESCGMLHRRDQLFRDLSGGQKQRVLVARALVSDPDVLVLDEPTNDLDLRGEHDVMEMVRSLHSAGRTVIMVSHLLHVVARYAHRLAFIRDGRLEAGDLDELLTAEHLAPMYGIPVGVARVQEQRFVFPEAAGDGDPNEAKEAPRST